MGVLNEKKEMEAFSRGFSMALVMTHDVCQSVAVECQALDTDQVRLGAVLVSERCLESIRRSKRVA